MNEWTAAEIYQAEKRTISRANSRWYCEAGAHGYPPLSPSLSICSEIDRKCWEIHNLQVQEKWPGDTEFSTWKLYTNRCSFSESDGKKKKKTCSFMLYFHEYFTHKVLLNFLRTQNCNLPDSFETSSITSTLKKFLLLEVLDDLFLLSSHFLWFSF